MRTHERPWKTLRQHILRRSSPGFTLVEVLAAVAIMAVLGAVGASMITTAARAIATTTSAARWNTTLLQLDDALRQAIDGFAPAYWAAPPRVLTTGHGYRVEQTADGATQYVQLSRSDGPPDARRLIISDGNRTFMFSDIDSFAVEAVRNSAARIGGIAVTVSRNGRTAKLIVAWKGQRV